MSESKIDKHRHRHGRPVIDTDITDPFIGQRAEEVQRQLFDEVTQRWQESQQFGEQDQLSGIILLMLMAKYGPKMEAGDLAVAKRYLDFLERDVSVDSLTGAYNRRQYNRDLEQLFAEFEHERAAGEPSAPCTIVVIDIDNFKNINSQGGLSFGDAVLRELIPCIRAEVRRVTDEFYRYGGEEFVLVLQGTEINKVVPLLERVRARIETELLEHALNHVNDSDRERLKAALGKITVSIGAHERTAEETSAEEVFERADAAMYDAKNTGRNKVVVYSPALTKRRPSATMASEFSGKLELNDLVAQAGQINLDKQRTPEIIINEYAAALGPIPRTSTGERGNYFPVDPAQGLKMIFTRSAIIEEMTQRGDLSDLQNFDAALHSLQELALVDQLTQLPNRAAFDRALERELARSRRYLSQRGLMVLDIDHFKKLNDNLGHQIGDLALHAFGTALRRIVPKEFFVGRIGGEEFVVLMPANDQSAFTAMAETIRQRVASEVASLIIKLFARKGLSQNLDRDKLTVSMGLAIAPVQFTSSAASSTTALTPSHLLRHNVPTTLSPTELKSRADAALALAKTGRPDQLTNTPTNDPAGSGRNRWVLYNE